MRITRLKIKSLRCFDDVILDLDDCTCLVGPNGSGKSTVLCALNIFFREQDNTNTNVLQLEAEDFHHKNTATPIEITVTFKDLSPEAQADFRDYYRQGELTISSIATFNEETGKAEVVQHGQRLAMSAFAPFFEAVKAGAKVAELKSLYANFRQDFPDLVAAATKDAMVDSLRQYESEHPVLCELVPSEDQFYGYSKGAGLLAKHVQWIYVPAVKDATTEQEEGRNSALGKLLLRTVRSQIDFAESVDALIEQARQQYQKLLEEKQPVLESISGSLRTRISKWAHPAATLRLAWSEHPDKSVRIEEPQARVLAGEGDFEGAIARFGHGLQRSYLLALLEELASSGDGNIPTLLLGCEEPELYQHPPQARHLSQVLQDLSQNNAQVIMSTHSPLLVSGEKFEQIRLVRKSATNGAASITRASLAEVAKKYGIARGENMPQIGGLRAKIHQSLQSSINELFFTPKLVLVEGMEDVAYIVTYLHLLGLWDRYRQAGCHIIPTNNKSNILQPLIIAQELRIPTFIVFDSDADKPDKSGSRVKHEKDNQSILNQSAMGTENAMPATTLWTPNLVMWDSNMTDVVNSEIKDWDKVKSKIELQFGQIGDLGKNSLFIADCLQDAWDAGNRSVSLEKLCNTLIAFAER